MPNAAILFENYVGRKAGRACFVIPDMLSEEGLMKRNQPGNAMSARIVENASMI